MITLKRAYEKESTKDGKRILVDRLWPRGIKKEDLKLDAWYKELTPSTELRKWYKHEPQRLEEFTFLYQEELKANKKAMDLLRTLSQESQTETITFIFAAKSYSNNHVLGLMSFMKDQFSALIDLSPQDGTHESDKHQPS